MNSSKSSLFVNAEAIYILTTLQDILNSQNVEYYLIGGYIRDVILERATRDIDVTVAGSAIIAAKRVADTFGGTFVLLDEINQAARVVILQKQERWYLDFTATRGSIITDLAKRDFTINAIACKLEPLSAGLNQVNLIDPFDGVGDIKKKIIRAINDTVFLDDPARLLRAFRFSAELDFSIDCQTESFIQRDYKNVTSVSGERVRDELIRILDTNKSTDILHHLDRIGILDVLLPELTIMKSTQGSKKYPDDTLRHSLETISALEQLLISTTKEENNVLFLEYSEKFTKYFGSEIVIGRTRRALLKLAALLHHTIKPQSEKVKDYKAKRFILKNKRYDATITDNILERLRLSVKEKRIIIKNIYQQLRFEYFTHTSEFPKPQMINHYIRETGGTSIDTIFLGISHHRATHNLYTEDSYKKYLNMIEHVMTEWFKGNTEVVLPKLINGQDLINHFGLIPGPMIGELLESVQEGYIAGEIETKEDALKYIKTRIKH